MSSVYPVGSRDQTQFFRLSPDLALVEMPLSGCKQGHGFREADQAQLSPLSLHQGGCTAGTEALGLWMNLSWGAGSRGSCSMFPQGCPCSVGSCHLEEELFPQQGGQGPCCFSQCSSLAGLAQPCLAPQDSCSSLQGTGHF